MHRIGRAALAAALVSAPALAQDSARIEAAFQSADRNNDGVVNVDEYVGHYVRAFDGVDADDDAMLSPSDVPQVDPARFDAADSDGDGMVDLGEAIGERMEVFFDVDANRDGVLTLDEVRAFEAAAN
jgi:hypothetical protein